MRSVSKTKFIHHLDLNALNFFLSARFEETNIMKIEAMEIFNSLFVMGKTGMFLKRNYIRMKVQDI